MGDAAEVIGFKSPGIPAFFEIGENAMPTGRFVTGGAWAENIPKNMAPVLKAFFDGR